MLGGEHEGEGLGIGEHVFVLDDVCGHADVRGTQEEAGVEGRMSMAKRTTK